MIGMIFLLVAILVSSAMNKKANLKLSEEKKAELITLFSAGKNAKYIILVAILCLYFINLKFYSARESFKKLKENDFPETYIRTYLMATALRFIGIAGFFVLLFLG
jgi:predicted permease